MTIYYVDDGGSNTSPFDTWAKAAPSLADLDDAVALAADDIVYIGHDSVDGFTYSAARTFTASFPKPTLLISATTGSDPPAYQAATANQIDTSAGAYGISFLNSWALYGVRVKSGLAITFFDGGTKATSATDCDFLPAHNQALSLSSAGGRCVITGGTLDLTGDTGAASNQAISSLGNVTVRGLTVLNASNRTTRIFFVNNGFASVSGCDFSSFPSGIEAIMGSSAGIMQNCLMPSGWNPYERYYTGGELMIINCGTADSPEYVAGGSYYGDLVSDTAVYRTGGATVEGVACSWMISTTANCCEGLPFYTPWLYGVLDSTGSKTFTVCVSQNGGSADLTDAEIWLEVEYLGTSSSPQYTLGSDHRATITATPASQTDDTTSTWTGITATYKQSLAVTGTVNETGLYRARVCLGKASQTVYIDPKVVVT